MAIPMSRAIRHYYEDSKAKVTDTSHSREMFRVKI